MMVGVCVCGCVCVGESWWVGMRACVPCISTHYPSRSHPVSFSETSHFFCVVGNNVTQTLPRGKQS